MAQLVELIEVEERRGRGVDGDPVRIIKRFFTREGNLAAEYDSVAPAYHVETGEWLLNIENNRWREQGDPPCCPAMTTCSDQTQDTNQGGE